MSESMINRDNYIVIQGWMIKDLKLKGNELLVYACIYGFSQVEGQEFTGSRRYLAEWTNSTVKGVAKNLKSLVDKGLIIKKDSYVNNVKFCRYSAIKYICEEKSSLGVGNKVPEGEEKSSPNNIDNNIDNTIENKLGDSDRDTPTHLLLGKYKNVLLTEEEYKELAAEHGARLRDEAIKFLDGYIQEKHYKSDCHYVAIERWVIQAVKEREKDNKQSGKQSGRSYDMDAMARMLIAHDSPPPTAKDDESIRARAEALKQQGIGGN